MDPSQRAAYSKQILENPVFTEVFDAVKAAYTDQMIATRPAETEKREHLHKSIHALADVRTYLTACVGQGKLEKARNVQKEKIKKQKEKEQ